MILLAVSMITTHKFRDESTSETPRDGFFPLCTISGKTFQEQTFLQFPAPYWISNRAHTITRLGLTRRFFQTADMLTFHVLMHFSMRFLPSKWFFNTTIWKFRHQMTSRNSKQKISGRFQNLIQNRRAELEPTQCRKFMLC